MLINISWKSDIMIMKGNELKWLEEYAESLEELNKAVSFKVGLYKGNYYEDGEFTPIQGVLYLTTHNKNSFSVCDIGKDIEDSFDFFDSDSTLEIFEDKFLYVTKDYDISIFSIERDIDMLEVQFRANERGIEYWKIDGKIEPLGVSIDLIAEQIKLVKRMSKRYPFEYEVSEYDNLGGKYSNIKYDLRDRIEEKNYLKAHEVALDFKDKLVVMLKALKSELKWLPPRFRKEFIEDIICQSPQDAHSVIKNCEYFSNEIMDELADEEKSRMYIEL